MDDKRLTKICRILNRMRNLKNITLDFSESFIFFQSFFFIDFCRCGLLNGAHLHIIFKNLKKSRAYKLSILTFPSPLGLLKRILILFSRIYRQYLPYKVSIFNFQGKIFFCFATRIVDFLKRKIFSSLTSFLSRCPLISDLQFQNIHSYLNQLASLKRLSFDISE